MTANSRQSAAKHSFPDYHYVTKTASTPTPQYIPLQRTQSVLFDRNARQLKFAEKYCNHFSLIQAEDVMYSWSSEILGTTGRDGLQAPNLMKDHEVPTSLGLVTTGDT